MTKHKTVFACQACGFESPKWLGRCPDCGEWNSLSADGTLQVLCEQAAGAVELILDVNGYFE